jgi:hypothetical protein
VICIIVTGSREWTDETTVRAALNKHLGHLAVVIQGDCRGLDLMADRIVRAYHPHWSVICMPAQWDRDGKAAGTFRNQRMLAVGQSLQDCGYELVVEAFPMPSSRGTWDMVRRAEKAGVRVNVNKPTEGA